MLEYIENDIPVKGGKEYKMEQQTELDKALTTLQNFIYSLAAQAGREDTYGEKLWQGISIRADEAGAELVCFNR